MEDVQAKADLGLDLSSLNFGSTHLHPNRITSDNEETTKDEEYSYSWLFETGILGNVVIVDNLPLVGPDKAEKLERWIYAKFNGIKKDGFSMPVNPQTQKTLGYCFIEYNTRKEAESAQKNMNGYRMDKVHTLSVYLYDGFNRIMNTTDEWTPPETVPYAAGENLQQWLTDEKARDQFLIRAGFDTEVFWNDARELKPELVHPLDFQVEGIVQWSPLGTYLTTVNRQGVLVWGGATTFNRLKHYAHSEVKFIEFSPEENYLVTYSCYEPESSHEQHNVVLNIFDVKTGEVVGCFEGSAIDFGINGTGGHSALSAVSWPLLRWCGNKGDKYFARTQKDMISVYETETFSLVGKKSIKIENVKDLSWSPSDPIIAVFVPEVDGGNQPARVSLIQIPDKLELRQKNLFSISDCQMYWQSNGEYLAVKVERYTKTKRSTYSAFELFRIKERDIPIEVLEMENKNDKIISFAWEPNGQRFALIHGDSTRPDISFYSMGSALNKGRVLKLKTLKGRQANALYWSPAGRFIILAGLDGFNGQLEFYDVDELQTMSMAEHYLVTDVEWDPSGRYVATSVTSAHNIENGFNIWSFYGRLLYKIPRDHLSQFSWRPRPPSLLSAEKQEESMKNLKNYSRKYEAEDQDALMHLSEQECKRRKMLLEEWEILFLEWKRLNEEEKACRQTLRDGEASEDGDYQEVKSVEFAEVISVEEKLLD